MKMKLTTQYPNVNLSQPSEQSAFTKGLDDRYVKLSERDRDTLKSDRNLNEFLGKAIQILKNDKNQGLSLNEDLAHYLMGRRDYLPRQFGEEHQSASIAPETKAILDDLLRTHRYGIFGISETLPKTTAKLEALLKYISPENTNNTNNTNIRVAHYQGEPRKNVGFAEDTDIRVTHYQGVPRQSILLGENTIPRAKNNEKKSKNAHVTKLSTINEVSQSQEMDQKNWGPSKNKGGNLVANEKNAAQLSIPKVSADYSVQEIEGWLFGGVSSKKFPRSKLTGRDQEKYLPKEFFENVEIATSGKYAGKVGVHNGGVTSLAAKEGERAAVVTSNNGDLLTGCGYAVAKAVTGAAGPGLQHELYSKYGVPDVMATTEYGKKNYSSTEGRGYAISCNSHDMKSTHNVDQIELVTVPMQSEAGVVNMYKEAFTHAKGLDYIAVPMAGMTHPVIGNNSKKSAELTMKAVDEFYRDNPQSKLKIIFTIPNGPEAVENYWSAIRKS